MSDASTAVLDVDGTLVDTNYQHAIAWYRAFREHDIVLPLWRIHRSIGMGGDQVVEALAGEDVEARSGDEIRDREHSLYADLMPEVELLPGSRELMQELKRRGKSVVLASSAKQEELNHYLDRLEAREIADDWTSAADVQTTKPAPDLVEAAIARAGNKDAAMLGDSTFDCEAARRAGIPSVALRTGGFSVEELRAAGAVAVFTSLTELCEELDETPLG